MLVAAPKIITDINQLDFNETYTYADYLKWRLKERVELIKGKIFKMSPAPGTLHQRISARLFVSLFSAFKGKSCEAFSAPFDVRLYNQKKSSKANKDIYTVVQPDMCVVCDESKLDEKGCLGAPDLIIEILSPGNSKKEMQDKLDLYEECGVREYWIVQPTEQAVLVYILNENGVYDIMRPVFSSLTSTIFPDLKIDLEEIFK